MRWMVVVLILAMPSLGWARSLPDAAMTPGAVNPAVTQGTIGLTICRRGWTRTVRPSVGYTEPLKKMQIRAYGYADPRPWKYEEDHLIPLDLGGSPDSPRNLWPEPHLGLGQWGFLRQGSTGDAVGTDGVPAPDFACPGAEGDGAGLDCRLSAVHRPTAG